MILILSEKYDASTDIVMDWLQYHFSLEVIRINNHDLISIVRINIVNGKTNYTLRIKTELGTIHLLDSNRIHCVWYRRGDFTLINNLSSQQEVNIYLLQAVQEHLKDSNKIVKTFLHKLFERKQIGNFFDNATNKLLNLDLAQKVGFKIPATIVTTEKKVLSDFFHTHKRIITKGLVNHNSLIEISHSYPL